MREQTTTTRLADDGEHLIVVERWLDRQVMPPRWRSKNRRIKLKPNEIEYYRQRADLLANYDAMKVAEGRTTMTDKATKFRSMMGPTVKYRRKTPREGEVVCHNFPPRSGQGYGANGFRYWTTRRKDLPEHFARCQCDWPVEEHYSPRAESRTNAAVAATFTD